MISDSTSPPRVGSKDSQVAFQNSAVAGSPLVLVVVPPEEGRVGGQRAGVERLSLILLHAHVDDVFDSTL